MLEITNVSKTFAKDTVNEHKALSNVNLTLKNGEFVTIVGSNGAGKSTLFNMICGTYLQDTGKIVLGTGCSTTSEIDGSDTYYTVSK